MSRGRLLLSALIVAALAAGAVLPGAPRELQAIVFAAMLAALWGTGSRLARWLVPDFGPESHGVAAFTFAVGIAVVPATWLGHLGWLRPAPFLAWTAAAFLLSRLLPRPETPEDTETPAVQSRRDRIETALLIAAALAIAFFNLQDLFRLWYAPAGPYGYDDISYHLSTVATWIRYGDLRMLRFSVGDPSTPFYPVLGEMASWVLIAPFRDSDVAARWTQIPFALFSFLATAAIGRRLGLSRRESALAAIAYAGIRHVFPVLAVGAGNDHSTGFFTLAGIDAALAFARRPRPGAAVTAGTALGLLLATKYIGVLFAPVVLALWVVVALVERREERTPIRRLAGLGALLLAVMAVTGGYTYLRNAVTTGNPIFPAPVRLLGTEILPGWGGVVASEKDTSPEFEINVWEFLTRRSRHFGSWFPFTLLPAALLAPFWAAWRRRWPAALTFALSTVFFLQFLFLMHDHRDVRYFLPAIALAAVAFVWLLAEAGPRASASVRSLLLAWIAWQAIRYFHWRDWREIVAFLAVLGLGSLLARTARRPVSPSWRPAWGWITTAAVLLAAVPLGRLISTYQVRKMSTLHGPLALERLAGPGGARVAYAGMNQPYFFFGSRFQNALEIVPRNRDLEARYYDWGSRLGEPYEIDSTYRRWRNSLDRLGVDFVVTVRSEWEDPERRWITHRQDEFSLAYSDPAVDIWRVTRPPREAPGANGYNPPDAEPADRRR
jgi:hypothetical protein